MIKLIDLPKIPEERGNLSIIEEECQVPFKIKRAYWIYDVPGGEIRGSHAFRESEELIVAISGSFDIVLYDGKEESKFSMNRSYYGIYIPKMTWRSLENFSTNSVALILSSTAFNADDYIRDFDQFISIVNTDGQ